MLFGKKDKYSLDALERLNQSSSHSHTSLLHKRMQYAMHDWYISRMEKRSAKLAGRRVSPIRRMLRSMAGVMWYAVLWPFHTAALSHDERDECFIGRRTGRLFYPVSLTAAMFGSGIVSFELLYKLETFETGHVMFDLVVLLLGLALALGLLAAFFMILIMPLIYMGVWSASVSATPVTFVFDRLTGRHRRRIGRYDAREVRQLETALHRAGSDEEAAQWARRLIHAMILGKTEIGDRAAEDKTKKLITLYIRMYRIAEQHPTTSARVRRFAADSMVVVMKQLERTILPGHGTEEKGAKKFNGTWKQLRTDLVNILDLELEHGYEVLRTIFEDSRHMAENTVDIDEAVEEIRLMLMNDGLIPDDRNAPVLGFTAAAAQLNRDDRGLVLGADMDATPDEQWTKSAAEKR